MARQEHPAAGASASSPIRRVAMASLIGTTIEWYDFYIYGTAAATVIGTVFFPSFSSVAGTLAAFSTFAVGFIARPLGGVFFGHFGDRIGRKKMLIISLLLMGAATFVVGLLPTYAAIGVWAPILLVTLRFIQGFAVGGEWGGAVIMAVEHAPRNKRGFYGSWPQMGVPIGLILSTGVFALVSTLPAEDFNSWGWRIPFLLSFLLVLVGLFIRLRILETPVFAQVQGSGKVARIPFIEMIRTDLKNVLLAAGIYVSHGVVFYVLSVFTLSYATDQLGIQESVFLTGVMVAAGCQAILVPLFGRLSDTFGRRRVFTAGAIFTALFAFPLYWLINTGQPVLVWIGVIAALGFAHPAMYAPTAALYAELFPARIRYSGASVGYQLGGAAVGFAPVIATTMMGWSGAESTWPISLFIIVSVGIGLLSIAKAVPANRDDLVAMPGKQAGKPTVADPT